MNRILATLFLFLSVARLTASEPFALDRCELTPLPDHQVAFCLDGIEKTRWHFDSKYPRPFFYPLNGASGRSLVRMGHPGAPNHDHHRGVWFAHHDVNGFSFWNEDSETQIRQKQWYAYQDGDDEAILASACGWYDPDGNELMHQDMIAALRPMDSDQWMLELQVNLRPAAGRSSVMLGQTNFGLLAVRVSKTISEHFGGGLLTSSSGMQGEKEIFGKPARWMDYSGPLPSGVGNERAMVTEGITYHDHPSNPHYPSHWHVRADGWMSAALCMQAPIEITSDQPLSLRYLLHLHSGVLDSSIAEQMHAAFANEKPFVIQKSSLPHVQYKVTRAE